MHIFGLFSARWGGIQARWRVAAAGLILTPAALLLSGCQAVVSSPTASQVRIIAASPDAPGLEFYLNNAILAYSVGFGSITSYISVNAGVDTIAADTAGTKQTLVSVKNTFINSNQYTVLVGNAAANLQALVLQDQAQAAPSGQISLRFIDQATRIGALDIYLVPSGQKFTAVTPLITNLTFGNAPSYLNVPTGTYTLVVVPTGTVPTGMTVATYTGAQVAYSGGSATTIILLDQQLVTTPGVQVVSVADYTSPTAPAQ